MRFGELVKQARINANLTIRALASQVGVVPSYLSELENSVKPAPTNNEDFLSRLSEILNLTRTDVDMAIADDLRVRKNKRIRNLFAHNPQLAADFFRASEDVDDEALTDMFQKMIKTLGEKPNE
jgi:transcriptional regulator with XRE-family HTH domain